MKIHFEHLSPAEIDELIANLAEHKAKTLPCDSDLPPKGTPAFINPKWAIWGSDQGSLLFFRHPGFGWVGFDIPHAERTTILTLLLNHSLIRPTPTTEPATSTTSGPAATGGNKILH